MIFIVVYNIAKLQTCERLRQRYYAQYGGGGDFFSDVEVRWDVATL